ncbi:MAG: hypothetical protein IJ136_00115 [Erysipelotrichaceae bacterium]|nr:hypothetical protein [Erysipelotrichaceae bacterium]
MELKRKCALLFSLIILISGLILYIYYSVPKIEKIDLIEGPIYLNVGEEKTIINDIYPDASFLTLSVTSSNEDVIKINKNKFSITAIKKGKVKISISNKGELIKEITVFVV